MAQYDLSGNPIPEDARTIPQSSASDQPAGARPASTWPPPPVTPYAADLEEHPNTSGQKAGVPPEIEAFKWNWGAFLLNCFWCGNHNMLPLGLAILALSFAGFIPVIGPILNIFTSLAVLGLSIYLGIKRHRLGWENRRFPGGLDQYLEVQTKWMWWGVGLSVIPGCLGIIGAVLLPILAAARHTP